MSPPSASSTQKRDKPHPNLYLGPGKVDELKPLIKELDANLVVADDELTPRQQRNLEAELDVPVLDRTAVILDIFAAHAHTAEGKMQVELAQLEYNMARMRGLWTHLERLGAGRGVGGIGTRGPGESQIETDRRLARDRITVLQRRLEQVKLQPAPRSAPNANARSFQRRARRLHERRQVDAAQRADRRRGRCPRPAVPHAGPDDPHAQAPGPHVPDDRHGRLHPQAAAPAGRRVRGHAGGDQARRHGPARRRRQRSKRRS